MTTGITWDLEGYFPSFDSKERIEFRKDLQKSVEELKLTANSLEDLGSNNQQEWEDFMLAKEALLKRLTHYWSYVRCLVAANSRNEEYKKESAALFLLGAAIRKLEIANLNGFKTASNEDFEKFCQREKLATASFTLNQIRIHAEKTMPTELEALSSDLAVNGFSAWERLYTTLSGKLAFDMKCPDGKEKKVPMAQWHSLLTHPNKAIRQTAFTQGNKAWQTIEDVCGQALNSIAGTRLLLNKERGFEHFLDVPLMQSKISLKCLEAIFEAIDEEREFIDKIAQTKAKALKQDKLTWYDYKASINLPDTSSEISWDKAVEMVDTAFSNSYSKLGAFFKLALKKRWVESELREGKTPGAFCVSSLFSNESRVYMTYSGGLGNVFTLAHEIGHAFHNYLMQDIRPFCRSYPLPLAECASTFAEMLLSDGILNDANASKADKLKILDQLMNKALTFTMDVPVRFKFEKQFHEERQKSEVSVSRLKEIMRSTMRNQCGDLLEEGGEDIYLWASKRHYFKTLVTFYNYPYSFGYLLNRKLYQMFQEQKDEFLPKYENFLRMTGSGLAHEVIKDSLGIDMEDKEMWKSAIRSVEGDLARYEKLIAEIDKTR